jgi:hypothetical protein
VLKISCLHTAQSDIAPFEAARRELKLDNVILKHRVRAGFLAELTGSAPPTEAMLKEIAGELVSLCRGADALILASPPLERLVAPLVRRLSAPIVLASIALAADATRDGGNVVALCTSGPSLASTRSIFESLAMATGAGVEVRLVADASRYEAPEDRQRYLQLVAEAADSAAEEAAVVALAQVSMAEAAALTRIPPFVVPVSGLKAAVAAAQAALTVKSS